MTWRRRAGGEPSAHRCRAAFARIRRRRLAEGANGVPRHADDPMRRAIDATDLRMMERAIALAAEAARAGEVPIAAVVYRGGEILGEAANVRENAADPTGHAEIVAMREAGRRLGAWRLEGCAMAVTLEPCPMCAGAAVNARLAKLVYGAKDPKAGACETLYAIPSDARLNHRVAIHGGLLAERCAELLRAFFRNRRAEQKAARDVRKAR